MMQNSKVRPIGLMAVALRAAGAPRSVVTGAWVASVAMLVGGVALLLS